MKKLKKNNIILFVIIVLIILFMIPTKVQAISVDEIIQGADIFVNTGKNYNKDNIDTTELQRTSIFIYNALLGIGMIIAIVIGMVLGIKYMTSGSEEKAEVKKTLIPYLISCGVIFAGFTIWRIIYSVLNNMGVGG